MLLETKLNARFGLEKLGTAYTWEIMKPKYEAWLSNLKVIRFNQAEQTAIKIIPHLPIYQQIEKETNVPAVWLAAINERESSTNFNTYLGNGDPLNRSTRHVPINRGPFKNWQSGAMDALKLMNLIGLPAWSETFFCFKGELYNGLGYEIHGIPSPYIFGGTSVQKCGKYTSDGQYNPYIMDTQLGIIPIYFALIAQIPSLALPLV